jgi:flagellar biogenesis protein FliO
MRYRERLARDQQVSSYSTYVAQTIVTLALVCAIAALVLWVARKAGVGRSTGPIVLVGHLPLDARRGIYLVKVGEQVFIVGASEAGFTKIGEMDASSVPQAEPPASRAAFSDVLARVMGRREGPP